MGKRRPHLSRTTIALLAVAALWIAIVAALVGALQRPAVRVWLARQLAERIGRAVGQPVTVGDLGLTVYPPRLTLKDVAVGPPSAPLLRVAAAESSFGHVSIPQREVVINFLRLSGVKIRSDLSGSGATPKGGWVRIVVRQLELRDLEIERLDLPAGIRLEAGNVEARWTGSTRRPASVAVLHAGSFRLSVPGLKDLSGSLSAWGGLTADGWRVRRLRGRGEGWHLVGSGGFAGGSLSGEGALDIDLKVLDETVAAAAGLEGKAHGRWNLVVPGAAFQLDLELASSTMRVAGFALSDVHAEGRVSPEGIEATLENAVFGGGSVEGSYALVGLGAPWHHRVAVRGEGVGLAAFLRQIGVEPAGLAGTCRLNAEVSWDGERIGEGRGTGIVDVEPAEGEVPAGGRVVLELLSDDALHIKAADLSVAGAKVGWEGRLSLGDWVPTWSIRAERAPVRMLGRLLEGWVGSAILPRDLVGEAVLDLRLRGPFESLTVVGDVAAAPLRQGPVEVDGLAGTFSVRQGVLSVEKGTITVGKGSISWGGELHLGGKNELSLRVGGSGLPIARIAQWAGVQLPLEGVMNFEGTLAGSLEDPEGAMRVGLRDVSVAGVSLGEGEGRIALRQGVIDVPSIAVGPLVGDVALDLRKREARLSAELKGFRLDTLSAPVARLIGGALDCRFTGQFPLDRPAGTLDIASAMGGRGTITLLADGVTFAVERPEAWRISGELRRDAGGQRGKVLYSVSSWRAVLTELTGSALPLDGQLAGAAEVLITADRGVRIDGDIESLALEVEGERVLLREPAHFQVADGSFTLPALGMAGPLSSFFLRAARTPEGQLSGSLAGNLPATLLELVVEGMHPRGRVEFLGEIAGTDAAPRFDGVAKVIDASLQLPGMPGPLTHVEGELEFNPTAIRLSNIHLFFSGGQVTCSGPISLSPSVTLDLELGLQGVRWPLAPGLTPVLSGQARLVGPVDELALSGQLVLQPTIYRRELNLQKVILEELLAPGRASASGEGAVALNLTVTVPGTLEISTQLARLVARGELRVVGTTAQPGVVGRLEVLPGGELELSGARYELDRATVTFSRSDAIVPYIDVRARTTVQTWEITVGLLGTFDRLTPTFVSNPPLPEMDIVALLSLGRKADESGEAEAGTLASSVLTARLTGAMTRRARTLLDLDQLSVDPFLATQGGNPTARLTVVKQLSQNWSVTLATNLDSNREDLIMSRWRLAPGVYLEAMRDVDSSYSLEVKWQRRY